ncbi:calcium:proton antiporter [Leucobacter aridicollis]|uniref:calcium:proton antiporter n=1 Tax=Leucobacter aridicollis TaxID=283878 RepID=UPI002103CB32|nr:calcium:proton antiporter [Leucobacter aridicollis]UTX52020.1 calcium:proton antiporter [Leucobacter aridicollis]
MSTTTVTPSVFRAVLTPAALTKLALGWGSVLALVLGGKLLDGDLPTPVLFTILGLIVAVILVAASGVVTEAEHLAEKLGDPYGTLVLTLSIVLIEVILISAVMLGPGEHATIARDSVMAVSMIILNLVIGVSLLVGGLRHSNLRPNRSGVSAYLSLLVVLVTVAFALPAIIGVNGSYTAGQEIPIIGLTVMLYAFFLVRQMGAQRADFQEVVLVEHAETISAEGVGAARTDNAGAQSKLAGALAKHRPELVARAILLVMMVVPIVLLSHDMASLLDEGLDRLGAPVALSGILIAMIVFLPETITAIRAALAGEIQRVSNLCHGALVSTVGLTIPAVLTIGLLTGQTVTLGEGPTNLVLLAVSLLLTMTTFFGKRVTALHGAAHLFVFVLYGLTVFQ